MNTIFPELPAKLGIYSLTQLLSVKEYSEMYRATQSYVDRVVAIEVLRPNSAPEVVESFQETARRRASAALPHVSPVLESAQTGYLHYLIQELPKGKTLAQRVQEEGPLTLEQAFVLVQLAAEMYCACSEQGVAAEPLSMEGVYIDGEKMSFFSPVISGEPTDELRVMQMNALADILTACLPENLVSKSNISIIIHWLRYGYGDAILEWQPLSSSLNMLRAQKYAPHRVRIAWGDMLRPEIMKRHMKRLLRKVKGHAWYVGASMVGMVSVALVTGLLKQWLDSREDMPAVTDKYVYCGTQTKPYRVQARPVSISEYAKFLKAWEKMTTMQKKDINDGMPDGVTDHTPLQWSEQLMASGLGVEWQGKTLKPDSPVCGVSYWGALAYARYVGGDLPNVAQLRVTRANVGEPLVEEWTSSGVEENFPLEASYVVYPAYGGNPINEVDPDRREKQRSFRVVFDNNNPTES